MSERVSLVRVAREGEELGEFYLSYVETALRLGSFGPSDLGQSEQHSDWAPLPDVAQQTRRHAGKKGRYASSQQKEILEALKFNHWTGMSFAEASDALMRFSDPVDYELGPWVGEPCTAEQQALMQELGIDHESGWTKYQASMIIKQWIDALPGEDERAGIRRRARQAAGFPDIPVTLEMDFGFE